MSTLCGVGAQVIPTLLIAVILELRLGIEKLDELWDKSRSFRAHSDVGIPSLLERSAPNEEWAIEESRQLIADLDGLDRTYRQTSLVVLVSIVGELAALAGVLFAVETAWGWIFVAPTLLGIIGLTVDVLVLANAALAILGHRRTLERLTAFLDEAGKSG